jgi:MFS family permease
MPDPFDDLPIPDLVPSVSATETELLPPPAAPAEPLTGARSRMLVPVLGLCLLLATVSVLMIFTLLNQIGASFNVSRSTLNWIAIVTSVVGGVGTGLFPALGSILGQRRLMVVSMGCLALGSVIGAVAPNIGVLIAGRVVASFGLAAIALSVAIVRERLSDRALLRALGAIAAVEGLAAGTGFVLGGVVEDVIHADWRAVFWVVAVVAAVAAVLALAVIPATQRRQVRRVDVPGAVLLAAGLVALLLPITQGESWGWASGRVIGLFVAAAVLLVLWVVVEQRTQDPLIQLRVLTRPAVISGGLIYAVTAGTVGIINATIPSFLETPGAAGYGFGASVLRSGLYMVPFALLIAAIAHLSGRLTHRVSPKVFTIASLTVETVAMILLINFHSSGLQVVLIMALFGAGYGMTLATAYIMIVRSVRPDEAGTAAGIGGTYGNIGGAVVTAVLTSLLTAKFVMLGPVALPAFSGYQHVWILGAVLAAVGAVFACVMPGARRQP